jgi:hypothetical protein
MGASKIIANKGMRAAFDPSAPSTKSVIAELRDKVAYISFESMPCGVQALPPVDVDESRIARAKDAHRVRMARDHGKCDGKAREKLARNRQPPTAWRTCCSKAAA